MKRLCGHAIILLLTALLGALPGLAAQEPETVQGRVRLEPGAYTAPGGPYTLTLELIIAAGLHINGPQAGKSGLIPIQIKFLAPQGIEIDRIQLPPPERIKVQFAPQPIAVYSGRVRISARLRIAASVKPGLQRLRVQVSYQACDERLCHLPQTLEIPFSLQVAPRP